MIFPLCRPAPRQAGLCQGGAGLALMALGQWQIQRGAHIRRAGRQAPGLQSLARQVVPGLHGVQRRGRFGDRPAQQKTAPIVAVACGGHAGQAEDRRAGQGVGQQQAPGRRTALGGAVARDGGAIAAPAPAHGQKIRLGQPVEQVARPGTGADHQRHAAGLQQTQAGQAHADVAHPIGHADIKGGKSGHSQWLGPGGRVYRLGPAVGGREGTILPMIVFKRVES